jgi:hypothetical protein
MTVEDPIDPDFLKKLLFLGMSTLEKMTLDELRDYHSCIDLKVKSKSQTQQSVDKCLADLKRISEKMQKVAAEDDGGVLKIEELDPSMGYVEGARQITFKDGTKAIIGQRTPEAEKRIWIKRILDKQRKILLQDI